MNLNHDSQKDKAMSKDPKKLNQLWKLFSNLIDAHFYIFEKWVVDFIAKDDSFSALKGEVLPYLVKKQFSKVNISKQNEDN